MALWAAGRGPDPSFSVGRRPSEVWSYLEFGALFWIGVGVGVGAKRPGLKLVSSQFRK